MQQVQVPQRAAQDARAAPQERGANDHAKQPTRLHLADYGLDVKEPASDNALRGCEKSAVPTTWIYGAIAMQVELSTLCNRISNNAPTMLPCSCS